MSITKNHTFRLSGLAAIWGGISSVAVEYLWLLSHGPTEVDQQQIVLGLTHHDFNRWSIFPMLLILPAIFSLHNWQKGRYGRLGLWGFRLTLTAWSILVIGQIWDYVLFDPWVHPLHGVGFFTQLLISIPLFLLGTISWGLAMLRSAVLPIWSRGILLLFALIAILGLVGIISDLMFEALAGIGWCIIGMSLIIAKPVNQPMENSTILSG